MNQNQNGQLILRMLENAREPATITEIVSYIAESAEVDPDEVKDSVMDTVSAGVRYGFIQRKDRKYYTASPTDFEEESPEEDECDNVPSDDCISDDGSLTERSKQRKRPRRTSKRRSSRSRRRRRR